MLRSFLSAPRIKNEFRIETAIFDPTDRNIELRARLNRPARRVEVWLDDTCVGSLNGLGSEFVFDAIIETPPATDAVIRCKVFWLMGKRSEHTSPLFYNNDPERIRLTLARHNIAQKRSPIKIPETLELFERLAPDIEINEFQLNRNSFDAFLNEAEYEKRHPTYVKKFGDRWVGKAIEHFISFELLSPKEGGVYLDVAADISPSREILSRIYKAKRALAQDLNYQAGIVGDKVGSDASLIPLPDNSCDGIVSHNSWEHFEGVSDIMFLGEAARLLKPGGKLCITPMLFSKRLEIVTSPSCWRSKYRNAPEFPNFDPRATLIVDDTIQQRQIKSFSVEALVADLMQFDNLKPKIVTITKDDATLQIPSWALILEKPRHS